MKKIEIIDIKEITLLSEEEAKKVDINILKANNYWWLRSPSYDCAYLARSVNNVGYIYCSYVYETLYGVRPALRISNLQSYNLSKNKEIECLGKIWINIGVDDLILMKDILFTHRFDEKSNDFEKSEIKQVINDWLAGRLFENKNRMIEK